MKTNRAFRFYIKSNAFLVFHCKINSLDVFLSTNKKSGQFTPAALASMKVAKVYFTSIVLGLADSDFAKDTANTPFL